MQYFVGLDWASSEHAVCVLDERGVAVNRFPVAHTAAGMADLVGRLTKLAPLDKLRVAIERPTGLIVDTLVEAKFTVVPIVTAVADGLAVSRGLVQGAGVAAVNDSMADVS